MARIGIDVTSALTQGGGIGRYTREFIHALAETHTDNHYRFFSAKLIAPSPVPNPLPQADNIVYKAAPLNESWLYRVWYRARLPIPVQWVTGEIDLFHSPDFVLPPVKGNIPTLLTVHDLSFIHYPHAYTPSLVNYLNKVVPWSVQRATHVLADSAATKQDLITLWQTPPEKITVLYSGVGNEFQPITNQRKLKAVRAKYNLGTAPYLFSVGTIQPRKNYKMLIRAFAPIAQNWPHNLAIAGGKGWLYNDILEEVEAQGLTDRVNFLGFVDDEDLPALYSEAAIFAFPSLYEGFGIPILEAMRCGVPVISSNASCLPEVLGEAGIQLPPEDDKGWSDALHRLLLDGLRREKLVGLGAIQAHKFNWQKTARQLTHIYASLL